MSNVDVWCFCHNLFQCISSHFWKEGLSVISKILTRHTHRRTYRKEIISFLSAISEFRDQFQHHHRTIKKFFCEQNMSSSLVLLLPSRLSISLHSFLGVSSSNCYTIGVVFRQLCGILFPNHLCGVLYSSFNSQSMFIRFAVPATTEIYTIYISIHTKHVTLTTIPLGHGHATCYVRNVR